MSKDKIEISENFFIYCCLKIFEENASQKKIILEEEQIPIQPVVITPKVIVKSPKTDPVEEIIPEKSDPVPVEESEYETEEEIPEKNENSVESKKSVEFNPNVGVKEIEEVSSETEVQYGDFGSSSQKSKKFGSWFSNLCSKGSEVNEESIQEKNSSENANAEKSENPQKSQNSQPQNAPETNSKSSKNQTPEQNTKKSTTCTLL